MSALSPVKIWRERKKHNFTITNTKQKTIKTITLDYSLTHYWTTSILGTQQSFQQVIQGLHKLAWSIIMELQPKLLHFPSCEWIWFDSSPNFVLGLHPLTHCQPSVWRMLTTYKRVSHLFKRLGLHTHLRKHQSVLFLQYKCNRIINLAHTQWRTRQ